MIERKHTVQILRDVKNVLVRHCVRLNSVRYSCPTDVVSIFGVLEKDPHGEFTVGGVTALVGDLKRINNLRDIVFRLENWSVHASLRYVLKIE